MFRLAHVTDPHFRSFDGAHASDFWGKRAVGALNLLVNRRRKHKMELLEKLRVDLVERSVDHLALTGDLSNVALEGEWQVASAWIAATGLDADRVTVIPGNHDAYTDDVVRSRVFERTFAAYQTADLRLGGDDYPFVRLRGDVALVAPTTSVSTGDLGAWGKVGKTQLERLESLLMHDEVRRRTRVVLLHHPPVMHRGPEARNLRDRDALCEVLKRTGADLVLHGHDHRDELVTLEGPGGARIPAIGAGSASYAGAADRRARYNVYEIEGASISAVTYAHDETTDRFVARRCPLA